MIEPDPTKLRELASWYREFAERTENPVIGNWRLRAAEDLETYADRIESTLACAHKPASVEIIG